jgi:hypothetical protein
MVQRQPETPRVVKEEQRENDCEGNPESELLVDCDIRRCVEEKEAGHGDGNGGGVVGNGITSIKMLDRVLAAHYGFTDEELDFIINYDIKYRMGRDAGADEEE